VRGGGQLEIFSFRLSGSGGISSRIGHRNPLRFCLNGSGRVSRRLSFHVGLRFPRAVVDYVPERGGGGDHSR
jgi:hypothetical protein